MIEKQQKNDTNAIADLNLPHPDTIHPHEVASQIRKTRTFPIISIITMGIFALIIGLSVFSLNSSKEIRSKASLTGPTLALTPAQASGAIGETITVGITLTTDTDTVSAAQIHLTYDPSSVQITALTPGSILPVILHPAEIAPPNATMTLGVTPTAPFHGSGILGSLTVKILKNGSSNLQFASDTEVAVIGKATNALARSTGNTVMGGSNTTIVGDLTGDGKVTIVDYTLFMNYWFLKNIEKGDLNHDGKIGVIDYTIFMNAWNDANKQ